MSHMDVCHRLKLQSVTALLYKLRMTAKEKGLGTKLGRGLGQTQTKLLQPPDSVPRWNEECTAENGY